jgi:hypothetical protein
MDKSCINITSYIYNQLLYELIVILAKYDMTTTYSQQLTKLLPLFLSNNVRMPPMIANCHQSLPTTSMVYKSVGDDDPHFIVGAHLHACVRACHLFMLFSRLPASQ